MLSEEDNKYIEEQLNTLRVTFQEQKKIELYKKFKEQTYEDVKKELTPILEKEIEQRLKEQHFKSVEDAAKKEIENHTAYTTNLMNDTKNKLIEEYKRLIPELEKELEQKLKDQYLKKEVKDAKDKLKTEYQQKLISEIKRIDKEKQDFMQTLLSKERKYQILKEKYNILAELARVCIKELRSKNITYIDESNIKDEDFSDDDV